jgi:hypothetical protein
MQVSIKKSKKSSPGLNELKCRTLNTANFCSLYSNLRACNCVTLQKSKPVLHIETPQTKIAAILKTIKKNCDGVFYCSWGLIVGHCSNAVM